MRHKGRNRQKERKCIRDRKQWLIGREKNKKKKETVRKGSDRRTEIERKGGNGDKGVGIREKERKKEKWKERDIKK